MSDLQDWYQKPPETPDVPETPSSAGGDLARWYGTSEAQTDQRLTLAVDQGRQQAPDQAAKVLRLSLRTGLPERFVTDNLETVEQETARQDFDAREFRRRSPTVADWMARNPEHAAAVQDDTENLATLENLVQLVPVVNIGASPEGRAFVGEAVRTPGMALSGLGRLYEAGTRSLESGIRALPGGDPVAEFLTETQIPWWLNPAQILRRPGEQVEALGEGIAPSPEERAALPAFRQFTADVSGGGGQLASQIAAAVFLGPQATTGLLFGQGADIQGDRAEAAGATPEATDTAVVLGASITAVTERLGLDALLSRVPPAIKNRLMQQIADIGIAGGVEAVQEVMEGVAQNLVTAAVYAPEQPILEGLAQEATTAGAVGGIARGLLNAALPGRQAYNARLEAERLQRLSEAAEASRLRERAPELFEELVREMAPEGQRVVYAPIEAWETLFQDNPQGAAQELLGDVEAYNEARATGGDIAIPVEVYASRIAPTEFNAQLLPELRFELDGMNLKQAEQWEAQREHLVEGFMQELGPEGAPEGVTDTSVNVFEDVRAQLTETGGFAPQAAEAQARLVQNVFRTLGQRTGMDPAQLYQRFGLSVMRQNAELVAETMQPAAETTIAQSPLRRFFQRLLRQEPPATVQGQNYTLDGKPVTANPDTPQGVAIRSLAEPQRFPLDAVLETLEDAGQTEFADQVRAQVADLQGRVGKVFFQGGAQTDTKAFRDWFGDSKVVDENGEPLVVYHGGPKGINIFESEEGDRFSAFFTADIGTAEGYRSYNADYGNSQLYEVYLSLQNPLVLNEPTQETVEKIRELVGEHPRVRDIDPDEHRVLRGQDIVSSIAAVQDKLFAAAKAKGYDSVVMLDTGVRGTGLHTTYVAFRPEQIKSAIGNRGTFDPNDPNILNQSAFHGTPHRFDKFSLEAIGTGEGAQAYGWGLYFAGKREIAEYYRETLASDVFRVADGGQFDPDTLQHLNVRAIVRRGELDAAIQKAEEIAASDSPVAQEAADDLAVLQGIKERGGLEKETGNLYQVDIPDDSELLDWDAPLSEQPESIQKKLAEVGITAPPEPPPIKDAKIRAIVRAALKQDRPENVELMVDNDRGLYEMALEHARKAGKDIDESGVGGYVESLAQEHLDALIARNNFTGERAYKSLVESKGSDREASLALNAAGIPGLRYLDATSRDEGEGSRNYVIWDEARVTVEAVNDELRQAREMEQRTGDDKRGQIQFDPDRSRFRVTLFENADLSTFLHESGHFYLEVMRDLIERGEASEQLQQDWQTTLDWFGVEDASQITVEQHEQWARGFEAYLREGKAPSPVLQAAFARFRTWLVSIYRALSQLNVELSDEIRGVFDRLVATDEEITAAEEAQSYQALFDDESAKAAGWTDAQLAKYRGQIAAAQRQADEQITQQAMDEVTRTTEKWWKQRRREVREQVAAEIDAQPVYQALSFLRRGKLPDGTLPEGAVPVKLDKTTLVDTYGEDILTRLPNGIYRVEGGVAPDSVASMFGYNSGDALVQALADTPNRDVAIDQETDARMEAEYGNILTDGTLAEKAMAAVHNDKRLELLLAEQRALDKLTGRQRPASTRQVVRAAAERIIAGKKIRDINPNVFRVAEAKAARQAFEAAGKQDWNAASVAKSRQLLNHELYRQAKDALEQAEKARQFLQSFNKKAKRERLGKAGADYLQQIDAILVAYEFRKVPLKTLDRRESLAEFLKRHEADVQPIERPKYAEDNMAALNASVDSRSATLVNLRTEADIVNWRQLTPDELQGVRDNAQLIWHLAKLKDELIKSRYFKNLNEAAAEVAGSITANANRTVVQQLQPEIPRNRIKNSWAEYLAQSRRIPSFVKEMDGGADGGKLWQAFVAPLNEASSEYTRRLQQFSQDFADLYNKHYSKAEQSAMLDKPRQYKSIGQSLTKDAVLAIALNWGNQTNRNRLINGEKWSPSQVQEVLRTLDARDWQFVQDTWDYLDSYWSEFSENHRALFGIPPDKVVGDLDPVLRDAIDRLGVELKGGYYPIKFDATRSAVTEERALRAEGQRFRNPKQRTRAGASISRVEGEVSIPLRLSVASVVQEHVIDTIHHIAFDQPLLDTARLVNHPDVRGAIIDHYGKPIYDRFNRLLIDVKFGTEPAKNGFERFINHVRNGTSVAGMAFSITTTMLQPLGLSNSIALVGAPWIAKGVARMGRDAASLQNAAAWATSQSEFMRFRRVNPNREIGDVLNRFRGKGWRTKLDVASFWMIANMQFAAVDLPTWYGAYEKAKAAGTDHDTAVLIADQAVRDAQGGGELIDQTEFQRGGPVIKLFTNFISYMSTTYSLQAQKFRTTDFRDPAQVVNLTKDTMLLMVVPAVGSYLLDALAGALTGEEPDEPEDIATKIAAETMAMLLGPFIGVREFAGAVKGYTQYEGPAGLAVFGETIGLGAQLAQGEADEAFWRSLVRTTGILFHLPAAQIDRTMRGAAALYNGETDNPAALLLGPPKD